MRTAAMLVIAASLLAGCNTVEGFGQDLSAVGSAISDASRDAREPAKPTKSAKKTTKTAEAKRAVPAGPPGQRKP